MLRAIVTSSDSVPSVPGFRFAGVTAGIKKRGGPDLGAILAERPIPTAAVLTTNQVQAAPVLLTRERVSRGRAQLLLVNSGCANACTGAPGMRATVSSCAAAGRAFGVEAEDVLPASTGVIGQLLPVDRVKAALPLLKAGMREDGLADFSRAILTTDKGPKVAGVQLTLERKKVTVVAVAKGAGMIHPNMATTLGFVLTDAKVHPALLRRLLRSATDATFNALTVDGDTSTNDCIIAMASGVSGHAALTSTGRAVSRLEAAIREVLGGVGRMIVADGEGSRHVVQLEVRGLRTDAEARRIAATVATSNLVKTAFFGQDPNWGRLIAAAGRAGVRFDADVAQVHVGDVRIVHRGVAVGPEAERAAHAIMSGPEYSVRLTLGRGPGKARYLTCDLGTDYVKLNADYRS